MNENDYNEWWEVVIVVLILVAIGLGCCTGCAHNPGAYLFGEQTRIGFGEYGTYNAVGGMLLTDVPRENTSLEIEIDNENGIQYDPATGTLKGITKIKRIVGEQITGYLVDLAKVAPEAAVEYLRKFELKPVSVHEASDSDEALKVLGERLDAIEDMLTAPEKTEVLK
jgi:hypothetical protein